MSKELTRLLAPWMLLLILVLSAYSQTSTAVLSGIVVDANGAAIPAANVTLSNTATGFERKIITNGDGSFTIPLLPPSNYILTIARNGFASVQVPDIELNVGDQKTLRVALNVGDVNASIEVRSDETLISTSPAVATSIDRDFISNLPTNGRSLQTLIALSPGVVNTPQAANGGQPGQFSVNGQRTNANNFTVDGMSGNFSAPFSVIIGQRGSGSTPAVDNQGAFSSLASADAVQEFAIQTSTFAPEFGRSPGAQISILTRSGENKFHGSLFEYFRNDKLDANDFFNNQAGIKRQALRYNNYGGTFGGPVILPRFGEGGPELWKGTDKTFFFFTFEAQRFVLPQPTLTQTVPNLLARQNAPNAISRALLNAFPLPNGAAISPNTGQFITAFSNPSLTDTYGVRIDHHLNNKVSLFGRVNVSNSSSSSRNGNNVSQASLSYTDSKTVTLGSSQVFTPSLVNEVRANWSLQRSGGGTIWDGFGGGVEPNRSLLLPPGITADVFFVIIDQSAFFGLNTGNANSSPNQNQQYQVLDNLSFSRGSHQMKFGADYRRLLPKVTGGLSALVINFSMAEVYNNLPTLTLTSTGTTFTSKVETYGFYGQDTWKINKRTSMTYGLRWEINPSPSGIGDKLPFTLATPPDLTKLDQSSLQLAPAGTPYYKTKFTNFAPRFGMSYLLREAPGRELVLRGGVGVFFDLGQSGFGDVGFPYNHSKQSFFAPVPLGPSLFDFGATNLTLGPSNRANITAAAPGYTLPRTYQWNLTAEQSLGKDSAFSLAYVGALGRKLIRSSNISIASPGQAPNVYFSPNFSNVRYIFNGAESSYHSLQAQFTKRLSKGMQVIANYTWSHSIDTASADDYLTTPGFFYASNINRADSDFDLRHNFSGAVTYNVRAPDLGKLGNALFRNWSLNGIVTIHSGLPYNPQICDITFTGELTCYRRPNLTGQPLYLSDPSVATGRKLNPAAFDFSLPNPQMGSLGRNSLRGEKFWQIDLGLHRTIKLAEKVNLELRAEAFNLLNHPNFLYSNNINAQNNGGAVSLSPNFGVITSSAARAYTGQFDTGFNPLFQSGGPRSMQLAFRLSF